MCQECSGTGLYSGFMEAKDEAVICIRCGGTGFQISNLKPFTKRRKRKGINRVRFGSGLFIDGVLEEDWMSYKEFEKRIKSK